ncbi:MAG: pro-sigmaK processing inhibitor BofA family protein [Oscillospiraceae bacterium]|nr:pro-sigmaK processing inhibitor BofA family protein [Oscillospiraceae bacterium]
MDADMIALALMAVAAVLLLGLFIRIIRLPLKWLIKAALHAAVGFVALFVLNFIGSWVGIELELNLFNALITGVLGVPGVLILLVFKYIL